jgi:regulation of enolase protein 1 (concanavalin A-like superfamily)
MTVFTLPAVPGELYWKNPPLDWKVEPGPSLSILAGESTDLFVDPAGTLAKDNAPAALFAPPDENFLLSARVTVEFASAFDAGVLQVRERDDVWAKLCFEYSPPWPGDQDGQGQPMIVSVVTRGVSDDCNSVPVQGQTAFLRIARNARTFAFHYSLDGRYWHMVRYFALGELGALRVGFSSQSPTGQRCRAAFSEIGYRAGTLKDNRNGE